MKHRVTLSSFYRRISLCLVVVLSVCNAADGQDIRTVHRIGPKNYRGLQQLPGTPFVYTYYYQDNPDHPEKEKFVVEIFNDTLGGLDHTEYALEKNKEVVAVGVSGPHFLLTLDDKQKNKRSFVIVDNKGETIQKKEVSISSSQTGDEPIVLPQIPEGFIVVTPDVKGKAIGYKVSVLGREMDDKSEYSFAPDKGHWQVVRAWAEGEFISILCKEMTDDRTAFSLHVLDKRGNTMNTTKIANEDDGNLGQLTFARSQMGMNTIGGLYYKNGKVEGEKPTGIFSMQMGPNGDIHNTTKLFFSDNNSIDRSLLILRGSARTRDGKIVLVSEQVKVTESAPGSELLNVLLGDFIVDYITDAGELYKTEQVKKTAKQVNINAAITSSDVTAIANLLDENNHFSFRDIIRHKGDQYIMYQSNGELYFYPIDSPATAQLANFNLRFKGKDGERKAKGAGEQDESFEGVLLTGPDRMVLYNYTKPDLSMQLYKTDSLRTVSQIKNQKKNAGK